MDLPAYFKFDALLKNAAKILRGKQITGFKCSNPRNFGDINHVILDNKDGKYAWRPLTLIHPGIYVSLVNVLTQRRHWATICNRLRQSRARSRVQCLSLPVKSLTKQSNKAEQIRAWWLEIEQKAIELSLDYDLQIRTDIVDCYSSIYTHSIAWALHTKKRAKEQRGNKRLVGNVIDWHIQDMQEGQTNGIPQGSILMDTVAEIVLSYADVELTRKIREQRVTDYQILRYRDDYRIFVNSREDGERILKCLTEVMIDLGLKLSPEKTDVSDEVIRSSLKDDKLSWMFRTRRDKDFQKHLLTIHDHSKMYPNSGSLARALDQYYRRLRVLRGNAPRNLLQLISITVDIAYGSPRTYPIAAAIVSKLLSYLSTNDMKTTIINKILRRFSRIPNTGFLELWLQRISHEFEPNMAFEEPLCQLVTGEDKQIWNNDWILSQKLRDAINATKVVDQHALLVKDPIIPIGEIELFSYP